MRSLVKKLHPQGIPWPASILYNRLSRTRIFRAHYRLVAQEVARKAHPGERILDIGTGPGFLLHDLAETLPGTALTGMDISPAMTDQARQNLPRATEQGQITFCGADAATLPFRDASFGCVVSTGSLHHWKHPRTALAEIFRVLKPGGIALIYDLVRRPPASLRKKLRKDYGGFRMVLLWLHSFEEPFMDPAEMEALAGQTRFHLTGTWFTGGLCCLALAKKTGSGT